MFFYSLMQNTISINSDLTAFNSIVFENNKYNQTLHQRTLFPHINIHNQIKVSNLVISFRFRSIEFNKKRALPFFLAMELLTNRKCVASLSKRNVQVWKIRKGRLVGCKVTLRGESLNHFINILSLVFPRIEKFQPSNKFFNKAFSKAFTKSKTFPNFIFNLNELVLFYPIELGLGLHTDIQQIQVNCIFNSSSIEERFFSLRYNKIPVLVLLYDIIYYVYSSIG